MKINYSDKLESLPPYLFASIDSLKRKLIEEGKDVIDLGVGDPDMPTPQIIVEALKKAAENPANYRYPSYAGMIEFRREAANFLKKRFEVNMNPESEIITLIGSKEGIFHFSQAFLNGGDVSLCPDPGYPVYASGALFAGGLAYSMPLLEKNSFLPDLGAIPQKILKKTKLLWVNYPNNPTSAVVTLEFFKELVNFAQKNNIILCHDCSYSEIFSNENSAHKPISIFNIPDAKKIAIEFHSLSKTFNMTGWRIGFACGNEKLIAGLLKVKTNGDSGVFQAIQCASIEGLKNYESLNAGINKTYNERRSLVSKRLTEAGFRPYISPATFYVWVHNPRGISSADFCKELLTKAHIVVTPGTGFGAFGEGYFRIALNQESKRLEEAIRRMEIVIK